MLFLCLAAAVAGCSTATKFIDRDGVQVYQRMSLIPYGTDSYSIRVGGTLYSNLTSDFYVTIPGKHLICFSTGSAFSGDEGRYLHVVPTNNEGHAFKIRLTPEMSGFGSLLGPEKEDVGSTYVDHIDGDSVFFTEKISSGVIGHYRLDLGAQTLTKTRE
jgi:hypothetical protein